MFLSDYASFIYSPYYLCLIYLLETVQRNFSDRLPGACILNYFERLRVCKLESLESRRIGNGCVFRL